MTERYTWLREAAVATLLASVGSLCLEAIRPGTIGTTVPLALPVILAALAAATIAALPPRIISPLRAWQLLAFGWIAAMAGVAVVALLRHTTPYALIIGVLAAAAVWCGCLALWLRGSRH
jgi:hypothetical protein